jgi:L-alanine-DL-glutamate epimerase-like enolase superfamily enzyme
MKDYELKITRAEVYTFSPIAMKRSFYDATHGAHNYMPVEKWMKLYDSDGVCGESPCSEITEKVFIPMLLNSEKCSYNKLYNKMYWAIRNNGFSSETYAELGRVDLALYDIMAQKSKMPLHKFLGAESDSIKIYASGCSTMLTEKELADDVERYLKEGYDLIKMKIAKNFGSDIEGDISKVALVRKIVGDKAKIAIDANQCWDAETAYSFYEKVKKYDIEWFEEPVHSHDFEEISKICSKDDIEVAMGESIKNSYMFRQYAKCGVKHLQPVWSNMGGIREVFKTDEIALKNNIRLSLGGITHITAALSAACKSETITEYLDPLFEPFGEITKIKPEIKNGYMHLPDKHGIPVSLDMDYLIRKGYLLKNEYY